MSIDEWWIEVKKQAANQGFSDDELVLGQWVTYFHSDISPAEVVDDMNKMWFQ